MRKETAVGTRTSRNFKNAGFSCLFIGFALELGGGVTGHWNLLKAGGFIFLMGIPLLLLGILLGRTSR